MKKTSNLPMVTTFYGWDMSLLPKKHRYWRRRYMRLFAEGEMFLLEGSHMAQRLIDLGCPSGKVRVHRLGVDLEKIDFIPRVLAPGEPVRVLMAASVQEKKGTRYAVEAFARACQRLPNLQLTLIGGARTREELAILADCQEIVRRENVSDKVRFLGYVPYPEYLSEMRRAHLFLAPSVTARNGDTEGGAPVASIEASAGGMPVLSTFHCDIPEVVLNGVSGLLVPERDVDALTKALLEIASSPEVWTAFGRAGREHIEREYNIKLQMRKQEELYSELMQG
jgi:colanic acid/amylovoran biosynthesis glycosyltransferase